MGIRCATPLSTDSPRKHEPSRERFINRKWNLAGSVGANQGWLKRCRAAASGNPTALAELTDDSSPAARALQAGGTRTAPAPAGDPLAPLVSYDWQVAVSIRSLTLALAAQLDPREGVDAIVRLTDQANLASGADTPSTPGLADTADEDANQLGAAARSTGL
jgi:hypothetical protein